MKIFIISNIYQTIIPNNKLSWIEFRDGVILIEF